MDDYGIKVGDMVQTGVYVAGEWRAGNRGRVIAQSFDGSVSQVDIGSPHGCAPWTYTEATNHLRKIEEDTK